MPRQTPSASDYTSVVRSSAIANDVASKPAGSPGAAKAAAAAVRGGGGLGSLGAIGSIVKQSVVAKSIAPLPVRTSVTVAPVLPLQAQGGSVDAFVIAYNSSGVALWTARISSSTAEDGLVDVATDSDGNVYATAYGGGNTVSTAYSSNGVAFGTPINSTGNGTSTILIKYNTAGIVQWIARYVSSSAFSGNSIATDSNGNVYITGMFRGTGSFTPYSSNGNPFGRTITGRGGREGIVLKYDTSGTVQWVAQLSSGSEDISYGVATDSSGNVYVTGQCGVDGTFIAFNFDGSQFGRTIASPGTNVVFVVKYNTTGTVQWLAKVSSTFVNWATAIATDPSGNVYVTGRGNSGEASVTAYSSNENPFGTTLTNRGSGDAFIVKYDTGGIVQWIAGVASDSPDIGIDIATDSNGNIYLTGQYTNTVTAYSFNASPFARMLTNSGLSDAFVVKYNTTGVVQWIAKIASTGDDVPNGIATDSDGNVYVAGQGASGVSVSVFNFDTTQFGTALTNVGGIDGFLVKYNTSGLVQWAGRIAGTGADVGRSVAVDRTGKVYLVGTFSSPTLTISNA